jgi:hypothetical protein
LLIRRFFANRIHNDRLAGSGNSLTDYFYGLCFKNILHIQEKIKLAATVIAAIVSFKSEWKVPRKNRIKAITAGHPRRYPSSNP